MSLPFDIVDLPPCDPPGSGDSAPDFKRPLVSPGHWQDTTLENITRDGQSLLVFLPMLGSSPARHFWTGIGERNWTERFDLQLVGVSISTPYEASTFLKTHQYPGRIFSDPCDSVADSYDLAVEQDGLTGFTAARPAVFHLDTDQMIHHRWVAETVPDSPDFDAFEAAIEDAA